MSSCRATNANAIEDRGRVVQSPSEWGSIENIVEAAIRGFRLPRWAGQDHYAELWVEKQALAGVLEPIAREYHVPLMVNKGYSSQSAMWEAAGRYLSNGDGRELVLFYLGDHDPSGEDMVRDIRDRLATFEVEGLDVRKLALTMPQIEQYDPPPNPAKMSDSRAEKYVEKHGESSWEVDALDPQTLQTLLREAFDEIVDIEKMDAIKEREETDKERLRKALAAMRSGK